MELLKDYNYTILYYSSKANVVVDSLSRKSMGSLVHVGVERRPLVSEMWDVFQPRITIEMVRLSTLMAHF